jgi:hypothetical protein
VLAVHIVYIAEAGRHGNRLTPPKMGQFVCHCGLGGLDRAAPIDEIAPA